MEGHGEVRVADQVIAVIAGFAAKEVAGIRLKTGGLYQGLTEKMTGSQAAKGISIVIKDGRVVIEMRVIVTYGIHIHHISRLLQEKVKEMVELLTGLFVQEINIRVDAIEQK